MSTVVPTVAPSVSVYFQVFPTAIGNGSESAETTDVEPPELAEPPLAGVELLLAALLEVEPEPPDEPELPVLQPVRISPPTVASARAAPAGWRSHGAYVVIAYYLDLDVMVWSAA
ncbi:MAG TPA: hypothetical protein VK836_11630 [Streptosporangiaceae bacterium]|nr:hypothetical protein [Streptosporangiaceae bacterium]